MRTLVNTQKRVWHGEILGDTGPASTLPAMPLTTTTEVAAHAEAAMLLPLGGIPVVPSPWRGHSQQQTGGRGIFWCGCVQITGSENFAECRD